MSADHGKSGTTAAKKPPAAEGKSAEAAPKTDAVKSDGVKAEGAATETAKTEPAPPSKGMGEGQKPVSQAYKDNWNAIFAKKKKR